jgi:hypothetical protein
VLERYKPPLPSAEPLHYLLFTPFRYPPLRHGSRFGSRRERGIWYGAESLRSAFGEIAYYRLLFLEGTRADLGLVETDLTVFRARVRTRRGIDLTRPPFRRRRAELVSKTSYAATQSLGAAMREAGVEALRYESARDVEGGLNVGVFTPKAFVSRKPRSFQTWRCVAQRDLVEVSKRDYSKRTLHRFPREEFLVRGSLPHPAI